MELEHVPQPIVDPQTLKSILTMSLRQPLSLLGMIKFLNTVGSPSVESQPTN
jgi:hypothetical protein